MTPERQWRVQFDADVTFSNGGGLHAWGFRLDAPGPDVTDAETGELLVRELGLLMVDQIHIKSKTIIEEPHKGLRGDRPTPSGGPRRVHTLSAAQTTLSLIPPGRHPLTGLVDLDAILVRTTGSARTDVDRAALMADDLAGKAILLHTGHPDDAEPALTEDAARFLAAQGAVLVGLDGLPSRIDATPAAAILTQAAIPIVAGLTNLDTLPPRGLRLHVIPTGPTATVYALTEPPSDYAPRPA